MNAVLGFGNEGTEIWHEEANGEQQESGAKKTEVVHAR